MERMGKTLFFRSGGEPLILSEEQREFRKNGRLNSFSMIQSCSLHCLYLVLDIFNPSHFCKNIVPE